MWIEGLLVIQLWQANQLSTSENLSQGKYAAIKIETTKIDNTIEIIESTNRLFKLKMVLK